MDDKKQRISPTARQNQLEFLHELYAQGVPVGDEVMQKLIDAGYIKVPEHTKEQKEEIINASINEWALKYKSGKAVAIDSNIDIVAMPVPQAEFDIITSNNLEKRRLEYGHLFEGREKPIEKSEWMPKSTTEHEPDFVNWINSINLKGFKNRITYRKFSLYCQQAYAWLSDGLNSYDFDDEEEREDYRMEELRRCAENNLYFLNKYVWYKDADAEDGSGRIKYIARAIHEVMAYLDDCGYSAIIAKARQIAATTTLMAIDVRDLVFKQNHFMKFITEDEKKAIEIFDDKLKFTFSNLESWMSPDILNEQERLFSTGFKHEKGKKKGVGSKILVDVPKRTAIAGGAPQKVKIDEGANIPILGVMIGNARPTMYWMNPRTNRLEVKRRLWVWATGGEMEKGGGAFQSEFMAIYNSWLAGEYDACMVPLFLDWTCRHGATQADYDREKAVAYKKGNNASDPHAKKHITEFYQSWPTTLSDVFRTSTDTLLDEDYIERNLKKIREVKEQNKFALHRTGYFEPVYDYTVEMPEGSDTPFKIIDAVFVPTDAIDPRASTIIFSEPKRAWRNRYFIGVDPIETDNGLSDFSSTVWDKYYKTPAALLAWRSKNMQEAFLQSMLLNIYYDDDQKKGTRELIESNRGSAYKQYVISKGYGKSLTYNYELPDYLQIKSSTKNEGVGIDSHGERTRQIVSIQGNVFYSYGENIYIEKYFEQAKTFTRTMTASGNESWGPMNKKYFKDDALWSLTYSYICGELCYTNVFPENTSSDDKKTVVKHVLKRNGKGKLNFVAQRVKQ